VASQRKRRIDLRSWRSLVLQSLGFALFVIVATSVLLLGMLADKWHRVQFEYLPIQGWIKLAVFIDSLMLVLQTKPKLFSVQLLTLLQEDLAARLRANHEIVGLDFDPFFNSQDLSDQYTIGMRKRNPLTR
jgi:hypothetical protein